MAFIIDYTDPKALAQVLAFKCFDTCCCFELHIESSDPVSYDVVKADSTGRELNGKCVWEFTYNGVLYYVWFWIQTGEVDTYSWVITNVPEGGVVSTSTVLAIVQNQSLTIDCPISGSFIGDLNWVPTSGALNINSHPCPTDICNSLCGQVCINYFE